ncbi:uncharacterized protein LOC143848030 [Tasmannia lanceolata]|uniref:uncharacterized protein LOC143848030 n=1 Tax=Tasmannia lanceolata TaxID=3420 RepID=UPI0040645F7A
MPITRYQIRNEYSLADPDLYRTADRDDPEALLEGVAMAGLIGVLRQLGDLAEFAAEIFHDLHEEVMSTAARGHGLMNRVQQLEAEFPSIEKAFLSQTSHSHFSYNAGLDWHSNLRVDQNLITQGDMPRFIMDYYEECRGPPRLFILDKFDIAGAGACSKRYSDPSFFKMEFFSSGKKKSEAQREKKSRKIKKKGLRWKNGETPEFSASEFSSKLNHADFDENTNISEKIPTHGVRLKRRNLNGSNFYSRTRRSYMEHILKMHSPEHNFSYENSVNLTHLKLKSDDASESVHEIHEVGVEGPPIKRERDRTGTPSPNRQDVSIPSVDALGEETIEGGVLKSMPEPTHEFVEKKVPSVFHQVDQNDALFDGESKVEASADAYRSDDNASELENYMDALTNMESEMETDTESKLKQELGILNTVSQGVDSDTNDEQLEPGGRHSDSCSVENSSASYDWKKSFKNGRSSGPNSETSSNLAELPPSHGNEITSLDTPVTLKNSLELEYVVRGLAYENADSGSAENPLTSSDEIHDTSFKKLLRNGHVLGTKSLEDLVPSTNTNEISEVPSYTSERGEASCGSCVTDSTSTLIHSSPTLSLGEVQLSRPDAAEITSNNVEAYSVESPSNAQEGKHANDLPRAPYISELPSQTKDVQFTVFAEKCPPDEIFTCGIPDASSVAPFYSSDNSKMPIASQDGYVPEEVLPSGYEGSPVENCIGYVHDLSNSLTLPREEQLHSPIKQERDNCPDSPASPKSLPVIPLHFDRIDVLPDDLVAEVENGVPATENSEFLKPAMDHQESGNIVEHEHQKVTEGSPPHDSENHCDAETHMADSSEIATEWETLLSNNLEALSIESESDTKDIPAPEGIYSNPFHSVGNNSDIVNLPSRSEVSDSAANAVPAEIPMQSGDLKARSIPVEADYNGCGPDLISSQEASNVENLAECLSSETALDQHKTESMLPSNGNDLIGSDVQRIPDIGFSENEADVVIISTYNPDFSDSDPSGTEFLDCSMAVEQIQIHMHSSNGSEAPINFGKSEQESESKFSHQSHTSESMKDVMSSSTYLLLEPANPLEQIPELSTGREVGANSWHEEEENLESLRESDQESEPKNLQFDRAQSPKQRDPENSEDGWFRAPGLGIPDIVFSENEADPAVISTDLKLESYNPGSSDSDHSSTEFLDCSMPIEQIQIHMHSSNGSETPINFGKGDQESESKFSHQSHTSESMKDVMSASTHILLEPANPLEQTPELLAGGEVAAKSLHEEEENPESFRESDQESEPKSPKQRDPEKSEDGCFRAPCKSSPLDVLSEQSKPDLHLDSHVLSGNEIIDGLSISSPTTSASMVSDLEACIPSVLNIENSDVPISSSDSHVSTTTSSPIFPSLSLVIPDTTHQQLSNPWPDKPVLDFPLPDTNALQANVEEMPPLPDTNALQANVEEMPPLPDTNALQANVEEMPPLPPLPPLEWRVGKLRHGFLNLGAVMEPLSLFAPLPSKEDEKPQHGSITLAEVAQSSNPVAPLLTTEDEKPQHGSPSLLGDMAQSLNSFAPISTAENEKPQHESLNLEGEMALPENSLAPVDIEDEKPRHATMTFGGEMGYPLSSIAQMPAIEDEKPPQGLLTLERDAAFHPNSFASVSMVEDEKPNENLQSRPRDPLIEAVTEAVASHDKSTLRKVSERVRPVIIPKVDERDSLLEQIRTKSFNLKPAIVTKPIIHGPKTNLNVAAILEKANAIRQALAGSDEDDDGDSWSDS